MAASQTFTVPSSLAEARRLPSGLKATLQTVARVPAKGPELEMTEALQIVPLEAAQVRIIGVIRHLKPAVVCSAWSIWPFCQS